MIPRLHKRGQSFKGACSYILHDVGQTSAERVAWTLTCNLASDPKWAWFEMYETWAHQAQLKVLAGQDARGRKNNRPVLHYTLAWAMSDNPTPERMKLAALASLKAMGLHDHEALIAAHTDKQHMHVHIVVNTVHPETGMTAPMKFTKLELSKWAEAYEREHGIHCDERIRNNEERRLHAAGRSKDALALLSAAANRRELPGQRPYSPVKHRAVSRNQWFDRKEITDRMKAMRAGMDQEMNSAREATWTRQTGDRDYLDESTEAAIDNVRSHVKGEFRPKWRDLYRAQKKEERQVGRIAGQLLDRAAFVYAYRARLGRSGTPLTVRQMLPLIRSGDRLAKRLAQVHEQERRSMARQQKTETKVLTDVIWQRHRERFDALRVRQSAERQAERDQQAQQRRSISFELAKATLAVEREAMPEPMPEPRPIKRGPEPVRLRTLFEEAGKSEPPPISREFDKAAKPQESAVLSRAEQIKRDMEEWRKRNEGRDFGREI